MIKLDVLRVLSS